MIGSILKKDLPFIGKEITIGHNLLGEDMLYHFFFILFMTLVYLII